ncbi:MAG: carboxymuconolactone decarboxylase family protein [Burkholderiales bacterium]|nr:carboxymuconolactone decarboxylase family protein [Burkholderiales bacterium]
MFLAMTQRLAYRQLAADTYEQLIGIHQHLGRVLPDARLRALLEIRVSQINGCAWCLDMHLREARQLGESQQRLDCLAAWRETPFFTGAERAALAWAEAVTRIVETHVPDAVYEEVKPYFPDKQLVDPTVAIGMINLWNRLSIAFRSEPALHAGS